MLIAEGLWLRRKGQHYLDLAKKWSKAAAILFAIGAVSVHDEALPQMVTAMASPAGRDENSSMPIQATPASERPIHTPLPSNPKRATINSAVINSSMAHSICAGSVSGLRDTRRPRSSATNWSMKAMARMTLPTAIES